MKVGNFEFETETYGGKLHIAIPTYNYELMFDEDYIQAIKTALLYATIIAASELEPRELSYGEDPQPMIDICDQAINNHRIMTSLGWKVSDSDMALVYTNREKLSFFLEAKKKKDEESERAKTFKKKRILVFKRDKGMCRYCGCGLDSNYTIDHVIPKSKSGTDDLENLVLSCRSCNSRKHTKTIEDAGMKLLPQPE